MTFQEVFDFAFKKLVPVLRGLAEEIGKDHFMGVLEKVAFESSLKIGQATARQLPCNDFAAFIDSGSEPSYFAKHVLTREIVEDTPQAFELKVTECLWAKTFLELGAADIGYSLLCNTDYADCQGFNPNITLTRSKTLMQGDDCCDHRFHWEE
ncbi:L-2-amino-thiazoline-4-carboxylic acid hydrolase, partial [Candidatus Bipolaricaulota bacterium]